MVGFEEIWIGVDILEVIIMVKVVFLRFGGFDSRIWLGVVLWDFDVVRIRFS